MGFPSTGTVPVPSLNWDIAHEAALALADPDGVREELIGGLTGSGARPGHVCTNSWVFSPDLNWVLLVKHPRFSWTNPGGHLDPGEHPRVGAARELTEETGALGAPAFEGPVALVATLIPAKDEHPEHVHYCLSYAFIVELDTELDPEPGQEARWFPLSEPLPEGFFGDNWHAHGHAAALRAR